MNLDQSAAAAPDDSESDLSKQDGQVQVRLLEIVINDDERKPTAKPQIVSTTTTLVRKIREWFLRTTGLEEELVLSDIESG